MRFGHCAPSSLPDSSNTVVTVVLSSGSSSAAGSAMISPPKKPHVSATGTLLSDRALRRRTRHARPQNFELNQAEAQGPDAKCPPCRSQCLHATVGNGCRAVARSEGKGSSGPAAVSRAMSGQVYY